MSRELQLGTARYSENPIEHLQEQAANFAGQVDGLPELRKALDAEYGNERVERLFKSRELLIELTRRSQESSCCLQKDEVETAIAGCRDFIDIDLLLGNKDTLEQETIAAALERHIYLTRMMITFALRRKSEEKEIVRKIPQEYRLMDAKIAKLVVQGGESKQEKLEQIPEELGWWNRAELYVAGMLSWYFQGRFDDDNSQSHSDMVAEILHTASDFFPVGWPPQPLQKFFNRVLLLVAGGMGKFAPTKYSKKTKAERLAEYEHEDEEKSKAAKIKTYWDLFFSFMVDGYRTTMANVDSKKAPELFKKLPFRWIIDENTIRFAGGSNLEEAVENTAWLEKLGIHRIFAYEVEGGENEKTRRRNLQKLRKEIAAIARLLRDKKNIEAAAKHSSSTGYGFENGDNFQVAVTEVVDKICEIALQDDETPLVVTWDPEYKVSRQALNHAFMYVARRMAKDIDGKKVFNGGLGIQTYFPDALSRVTELIEFAKSEGITFGLLRVVKGAYHEQENKADVHQLQGETNENFLQTIELLFQNADTWEVLECASLRTPTIGAVVELMFRYGINPERVRFSQLNGLKDTLTLAQQALGLWTGKYIPYGPVKKLRAYLRRRLGESPKSLEHVFADLGIAERVTDFSEFIARQANDEGGLLYHYAESQGWNSERKRKFVESMNREFELLAA